MPHKARECIHEVSGSRGGHAVRDCVWMTANCCMGALRQCRKARSCLECQATQGNPQGCAECLLVNPLRSGIPHPGWATPGMESTAVCCNHAGHAISTQGNSACCAAMPPLRKGAMPSNGRRWCFVRYAMPSNGRRWCFVRYAMPSHGRQWCALSFPRADPPPALGALEQT